jgi:hypothetical protein
MLPIYACEDIMCSSTKPYLCRNCGLNVAVLRNSNILK